MHRYRVFSALAAMITFGTLPVATSEAGQYEKAANFSAAQAIQGVPLHGANYSIGDSVLVENFQYVFSVNTKWGPFRRSEERRVGKECRSRWSADQLNTKEDTEDEQVA